MFPNEIWSYIFSFVQNPEDVLTVKLVCKGFKSLVEREFDHSYHENLPFWHCFKKGYFEECSRLLREHRVLSTIFQEFFPKASEIIRVVFRLEPIMDHLCFIEQEIYPILIKLDPLPHDTFKWILKRFNMSFSLVEWALDHRDFPLEILSNILDYYFPILHEVVFFYVLERILPRLKQLGPIPQKSGGSHYLLYYGCEIGCLDSVRLLMENYGISGDKEKSVSLFYSACKSRNTNLVKYLTGKLSDSAPALNTVLVNACRLGDTGFVSFLLTLPLINMEFSKSISVLQQRPSVIDWI